LCKEWLLQNAAPSVDKTKAVGRYLVALSTYLSSTVETGSTSQAKQQQISSRRRQLHLLYLLHDLIHHVKFHGARLVDTTSVIRTLESYVCQLVTLAATYDSSRYNRHLGRLNELINLWGESNAFPPSVVALLRDNVTNALNRSVSVACNTELPETNIDTAGIGVGGCQKDAPYIMPASHGDASLPFYDLPAGNLMPCIIPNSLTPISPRMVKPLQFRAGPADEKLVHVVKAFLQDTDVLYGSKSSGKGRDESDIDQLGQQVALDDAPKDIPCGEGYYGWSKAFCEKMKLRSSGDQQASSTPRPDVSQQLRKRRRRSSLSSGRSFSPSSATSRSKSRSKEVDHRRRRESDSRSRSQTRRRHYRMSEARRSSPPVGVSPSRSRSRSYSPPDVAALQQRDSRLEEDVTSGSARDQFPQVATLPSALLQEGFLGPGQIPIPPPPPPDYTGPWVSSSKHDLLGRECVYGAQAPPPPPPLSAPMFMSQKPAHIPPLPTYPANQSTLSPPRQLPTHISSSGSAQTFYGQASGNFTSRGLQGSTDYGTGQLGRRQAPLAGGTRGRKGPL
ncbi:MAG: hypothetical protein Q9226_003393, partial [Calogaya cf. arnoldii]